MVECIYGKDQYVLFEDISAFCPSLHFAVVFLCRLPNLLDVLFGQFIRDDLISKDVLKVIRNQLMEKERGEEVDSMTHLLVDEEGLYYFQVILDDSIV